MIAPGKEGVIVATLLPLKNTNIVYEQDLNKKIGNSHMEKLIIAACRKKHQYYMPAVSTFSAWADVLERHLPEMQQEATRTHSPHER